MNTLIKAFVFAGILLLSFSCKTSTTKNEDISVGWPEISKETKPWTRWWWLGSSVEDDQLKEAMKTYTEAGLGGLEITPIYGVKGLEDQFVNFTSDEWMEHLVYTLKTADSLGLGVDMALASGWPFGGPWVKPEDACKYAQFKTWKLPWGGKLDEKILVEQRPIMRAVGHSESFDKLKFPIAENNNLQYYAFDQVRFPVTLKASTVMAFANDGEIFEITDKVDENGRLNWESPEKDWTIVAVFPGLHGKMVERAGPGGEGDVIDHFSKKAIEDYLAHFDDSFQGYNMSALRAFFNDSYEVDDARGEANWTPEFFQEFKTRRGYDLKEHLPAFLGMSTGEEQKRLRSDYRATISELLLENYTIPWANWSKKYNKIIRNQGHGSPSNILDLYAASGIPETEGTDLINIKFASSAAHVTGKKLTAAEAATWLKEHFQANLADTKENVDRYLIGGVNHIVYHGTPFSPADAEWPGRMFYAAVHYAPTNPLWRDFPAFNGYVTRVQSFLQRGTADNDILLYFPIEDHWMNYERSGLPHYHGAAEDSETYHLAEELTAEGYAYDFISDKQIQNLSTDDESIVTEGNAHYKTVLVPALDFMPLETFKKLYALSKEGAKIIFMDKLPDDVPGLSQLETKRKELKALKEELTPTNGTNDITTYSNDKGKILTGKDHAILLSMVDVVTEALAEHKLGFIRLNDHNTKTYFITNWSGEAIDELIPFNTKAKSVVIYNPETGVYGHSRLETSEGRPALNIELANGQSVILQFWDTNIASEPYPQWTKESDKMVLDKNWRLDFTEGGPSLPEAFDNVVLGSWTNLSKDAANFSGTARYSTEFIKPDTDADAWFLDLGTVNETAEVFLNGAPVGTLTGPEFSLVIDTSFMKKQNKLDIYVTNLMANRIIYMDKNNLPYRKFYNINFAARLRENVGPDGNFTAINWEPFDSGLTGPVELKALKKQQ